MPALALSQRRSATALTDKARPIVCRWFLDAYDAYPSYIQRCDAARYFIMYSHGGVYADLDYECTKPFEPVLRGARAVFSHKQGANASRGLVNAIFASEAHHPLWRTVFQLMLDRANASASGGAALPFLAWACHPPDHSIPALAQPSPGPRPAHSQSPRPSLRPRPTQA